MVQKFTKKELERLGCNEDEIKLVMQCQKKFFIILDNDENTNGFCIDARTLYHQLISSDGVLNHNSSRFNDWISKRIKKYNFKENLDFLVTRKKVTRKIGASIANEYTLTFRMAEHLAMVQNNDNGFELRDYFCLMENIVKRNKDWWNVRNPEKKEYNSMCKAVSDNIYRHSGRTADKYDYSREANILNIIATGSSAQSIRNYFGLVDNELTRDSLEQDYNEKLTFLQKQNIIYLGMNLSLIERIKLLIAAFDVIYPTATPVLPYMSKDEMFTARQDLLLRLE
ncbi:antA/AntB antirepressor family protein [Lachnospiraceae bacterium OttesenSCG-928-D06]|nr:antA/AntB antirepressor family protein [Lachnospiraceae bacterium OttesenSCG-928-D06]